MKNMVLTKEEQDVLILAAQHPNNKFLSNREIGKRLGISVSRLNTLLDQACVKLGVRNRNEAAILALKRGEIKLTDFWTLSELGELYKSLDPDILEKMASLCQRSAQQLLDRNGQTITIDRKRDGISCGSGIKTKRILLTKEERDILVLASLRPNDKFLSNAEIGQRLGISVNRAKMLIHRACVKLGAHNRNEVIMFALKRGEIKLTDSWSLDELAEFYSSLGPNLLRRMANVVRRGGHAHFPRKEKQIIIMDRRREGILTNRERDVLILAGLGLTNKEIADRLYVSVSTVITFLNQACRKLGARKRADAFVLAVKRGEISLGEITSYNEIVKYLAPLGAESIENIALLMEQKLG